MDVHIRDEHHEHFIVGTFPEIFSTKTFHDVLFVCKDGKVVESHRLVLGAVSPFLQALFVEQAFRDVIHISLDCDASDLLNVLRFAYEGVVRLDKSEMKSFWEIKLMLGLNISTEVVDSNTGNESESPSENTTSILQTREESHHSSADQELDKPGSGPQGTKRKSEEEHPVSKKRNLDGGVIQNLNEIISNLSPPLQNQQSENSANSNGKQNKPMLIPVKYLPALLEFIEKRKSERRLEELIEVYVKKYLFRLKTERRKTKKDKNIVNGGASPSDSRKLKQGPSSDPASSFSKHCRSS